MATWYPEGYGSNQKYYYPPVPPPLNPNPPPWRGYQPRPKNTGSDRTSSSASQASVPLVHVRAANPGYPQLDLMDGVDYFKIGDMVRIRRWNATTDSFSEWVTGQIVRPTARRTEPRSGRTCALTKTVAPRSARRDNSLLTSRRSRPSKPTLSHTHPLYGRGMGAGLFLRRFLSGIRRGRASRSYTRRQPCFFLCAVRRHRTSRDVFACASSLVQRRSVKSIAL